MDRTRTTANTVDGGSGEQRLERPRSARHDSQRRPVNVVPVESCVSPTFSTTATIDDDDEEEDFPPVFGDPVPPSNFHVLQAGLAWPPEHQMLTSTELDQRSRSSSRSPTSTTAASGGLYPESLAEARQRVLDRYDRKQRPPSSVKRRQQIEDDDTRRPMLVDDFGTARRRQQRLEPLTAVNGLQTSSACSVQHHQR